MAETRRHAHNRNRDRDNMSNLRGELQVLLNRYSAENGSNTPDFILAQFLDDSLLAFDHAVNAREAWYGRGQGASK
jgi:hypothetical protein